MSVTKKDPFDLLGTAAATVARASAPEPAEIAHENQRGAKGAAKGREKGKAGAAATGPRLAEGNSSVYLYAYQSDVLLELEYRARKRGGKPPVLSAMLRDALDEYLVRHASELGLTEEEAGMIESRAACA